MDFGEEQVATDVPGAHLLRLQDDEDEQAGSSDEWSVDEDVPMTDSDADESDQEDDDEEPPMLVDEDEAAALREMVAAGLEMQKQATVPLGAVEILTPKVFPECRYSFPVVIGCVYRTLSDLKQCVSRKWPLGCPASGVVGKKGTLSTRWSWKHLPSRSVVDWKSASSS